MAIMLIADDNRQITSILEEYAKKEGYEVKIAYDGRQALEAFEKHKPDVVLLDVMMPMIDGFEVCRRIRKVSNVPVIMITARGEDFEKIMGLELIINKLKTIDINLFVFSPIISPPVNFYQGQT
jgi:DNA-binding response OmpR family regulator